MPLRSNFTGTSQVRARPVTGAVPVQTSTSWQGKSCCRVVTTPATAPTLPTMPSASVSVYTFAPARRVPSSTISDAWRSSIRGINVSLRISQWTRMPR